MAREVSGCLSDPEPPSQPTSSRRSSQVSERRRSRERTRPPVSPLVPEELQQIPLDPQILRGSQEALSNQSNLRGWPQRASLTPNENLVPIFPSGCEGKLGVALESLQGRRDLT